MGIVHPHPVDGLDLHELQGEGRGEADGDLHRLIVDRVGCRDLARGFEDFDFEVFGFRGVAVAVGDG